jgi:uncharacterized protein (DUF58 family)
MLAQSTVGRVVPARGGRLQVLRILHELMTISRPRTTAITDLAQLLDAGLGSIKRRSLLVIVSDFISAPGWESSLSMLNRGHEVIAVCIRDPREVELPDVGTILMEDSETGEQMEVDTHDQVFRTRFRDASLSREASLRQVFNRVGVDSLWLSTDEDLLTAFVRFAALREKRRRTSP